MSEADTKFRRQGHVPSPDGGAAERRPASAGEPGERDTAQPDTAMPVVSGDAEDGRWVTARTGASGFRTDVEARTHVLVADEPVALGGTDAGPTPYEYLLGALGGCTAITLRMYADRRGWPLTDVEVRLRTARSHERDCEECATEQVDVGRLERRIELGGPLSDEQRTRLLQIADRCPVKQSLERGIRLLDAPGE